MGGSPAGLGVISASEKWRDCACTGYFYSHDLKVAATQRQSRQLICRQERRSHRTWRAQFFFFFFFNSRVIWRWVSTLSAAHYQMALYVSQRSIDQASVLSHLACVVSAQR